MIARERLEELRRTAPDVAGGLVGLVVDNPAQFAMVASGAYVVTRALGRIVRPYGFAGCMMTAAASYGMCWWLLAEARRRGVLVFRVRHPVTGELLTVEELAEHEAAIESALCDCGRDEQERPPLIDLAAVEREVARRAAPPG